jgi:cytochrome b subunit of formate dehydrogenase
VGLRWVAWLIAVAAIVLLLAQLGWVVFKPSVEAGDVFFRGQSKYMLQLYVAYLIAVCFLGFLVVFVRWRQENGR